MIQKPRHSPSENRIGIKQDNMTPQMHAQVLVPQEVFQVHSVSTRFQARKRRGLATKQKILSTASTLFKPHAHGISTLLMADQA
jgi:hypothetical protein